jgi:secondary thiamine-phosphate synthase enzyme
MKAYTEYLKFHTGTHRAYIHLTPQIEQIVSKSGIKEGMVLVSAMHITAGVYVNDNEDGLIQDIDQWLERLAPFNADYKHHQTGEDNGDSHLKALLINHRREAGPWHLAADFLRRVRRPAGQARNRKSDGRMSEKKEGGNAAPNANAYEIARKCPDEFRGGTPVQHCTGSCC